MKSNSRTEKGFSSPLSLSLPRPWNNIDAFHSNGRGNSTSGTNSVCTTYLLYVYNWSLLNECVLCKIFVRRPIADKNTSTKHLISHWDHIRRKCFWQHQWAYCTLYPHSIHCIDSMCVMDMGFIFVLCVLSLSQWFCEERPSSNSRKLVKWTGKRRSIRAIPTIAKSPAHTFISFSRVNNFTQNAHNTQSAKASISNANNQLNQLILILAHTCT